VALVSGALQSLDPTGSMFTSHHLPLVQLAYHSNSIEQVLPFISNPIVFFPGMRGQTEPRPLCDMRLPPSSYITVESGLTSRVRSSDILEYDFVVGLCYLRQRQYHDALAAYERIVTYPSKDHGCSKIMVDGHNKWVLASLLAKGTFEPHQQVTQAVSNTYSKMGKPYLNVAMAFKKPDNAAALKAEVEKVGWQFWIEEGNGGLMKEVLASYQPHHILRLGDVYSQLHLEDIRTLTQSAVTASHLQTAGEVEALLRQMFSTGMLKGSITKPDGSIPADGQGYLTFLAEEQEMDEELYMQKVLGIQSRLQYLEPILRATNERLSTSRDFVKHLVRKEVSEKGQTPGAGKDADLNFSYDSQIEDEDLMVGS
jgi:COP9 signalosome complex subunit 3